MRVLIITDLFPPVAFGGYERSCAVLVDALRRRHDITVLTSDLRRRDAPAQPGVRRELRYLGPRRREAVRVPAAAAHAAAVTRQVLRETCPEVVYVWNCLGASQAAPCAALHSGTPMAYRLSELWFASSLYTGDRFVGHLAPGGRGLRRPWSRLVRTVNRHPALRLDPSRSAPAAVSWCSDDLRARVTLPPAVAPVLERTIHPGVGAVPFAAARRRPADEPTIVYAGRVTVAKGAEIAVHALAALRCRHELEARLVLAGHCEPGMARRIGRLARELGVGARVEIAGALAPEVLAERFASAHAVVVPTLVHEAFGRVCVEAALARTPVVAARIGGIPEALRDGEHALLFEPGDPAACAAALAATLADPGAARRRAERAFRHAQQFSVERFATAEEAFLEETAAVLGRGAG